MTRSWIGRGCALGLMGSLIMVSIAACGGAGGAPASAASDSMCSERCEGFNGDGECDDGGEGSQTALCDYGTDCADCGARAAGIESAPTSASERIGPEGGRIALGEFSLAVPAGALEESIEITVTETSLDTGEGGVSAVYDLLPDGQQFLEPVTLTLPIRSGATDVAIYTGDWNQGHMYPLETRVVTTPFRAAVAETRHFTHAVVRDWSVNHDYSRCWAPVRALPHPWCTRNGRQRHIGWGIDEFGGSTIVRAGEKPTYPQTTVVFSNLTTELVILEYFEVKNAENVRTWDPVAGVRLDDLTRSDRVLAPTNLGAKAFRDEFFALESEPRKRFWVYTDGHEWVFPEDEHEVMKYDFCIGYRLAGGESERPVCGHYESTPIEPPPEGGCGQPCGGSRGECTGTLTCFDSSGSGPCQFIDCSGFCAPSACDGTLSDCRSLCDDHVDAGTGPGTDAGTGTRTDAGAGTGADAATGTGTDAGSTDGDAAASDAKYPFRLSCTANRFQGGCDECFGLGVEGCMEDFDLNNHPQSGCDPGSVSSARCPTDGVQGTCALPCNAFNGLCHTYVYTDLWCETHPSMKDYDLATACENMGGTSTGGPIICN